MLTQTWSSEVWTYKESCQWWYSKVTSLCSLPGSQVPIEKLFLAPYCPVMIMKWMSKRNIHKKTISREQTNKIFRHEIALEKKPIYMESRLLLASHICPNHITNFALIWWTLGLSLQPLSFEAVYSEGPLMLSVTDNCHSAWSLQRRSAVSGLMWSDNWTSCMSHMQPKYPRIQHLVLGGTISCLQKN